jgi:predicted metal-dependent hydrolase
MAYSAARWAAEHRRQLFDRADPVAATLFLWHLAEEVEHKTVAFDVFAAHAAATVGDRRFDSAARSMRAAGMTAALVLLAVFCLVATATMLAGQAKRTAPAALLRLVAWSISLAFDVLPLAVVSLLPGHDPRRLADPTWFALWLAAYDPSTGHLPAWNDLAGSSVRVGGDGP